MVNLINAWFASLYSISPKSKHMLLNQTTIKNLYLKGAKDLTHLTPNQIEEIETTRNYAYLKNLNTELKCSNSIYIHYTDANYPKNLLDCDISPIGIFLRGNNLNLTNPIVAIIGSRNPTDYGKKIAYELSFKLAPYCTIISGLASGIDTIAHEGCLDNNGYTIGVIGCGTKNIYPLSSYKTFNKMYERGSIVSEYSPTIKSKKWHFPARNRIISALCDVLIVVEANIKSGTSITCNEALNLGKDIFAVPARLTDKNSYGCLKLIKDGAFLLNSYKDILEYFCIQEKTSKTSSSIENKVLEFLNTPHSIIDIKNYIGIDISKLSEILIKLEVAGLISQILPNVFKSNT